jgi:cytochrome c oxidase subunit 2
MFINLLQYFDIARPGQINFQDPATPIMEGIIDLHHNIFFYLIVITALVLWMLVQIMLNFSYNWDHPYMASHVKSRNNFLLLSNIVHGTWLEIIWTLTPSIILMLIAVPSFALLYSIDELIDPAITLKVVGHQWYWSYEYSDYNDVLNDTELNFDSYMLSTDDLTIGDLRLLEVDNAIVLPINTHVRVIVTATDVLHSWGIPSLGIKIDAVPGRLNQVSLFLKREGTFYGQCSEICGVNHGFMPIVVKGV